MKTGIIGLPGSGKSTLFDLLAEVVSTPDPSHHPGKPRMRSVKVRDPRLERLRDDYQPKKFTPAALEILDFPGVKQDDRDRAGVADLLAPAREMDALIVVLRDFRNPSIEGGDRADPLGDLNEVLGELLLSDLVIVQRRLERLAEKSRKPAFTEDDRRERKLLEVLLARLEKEERGLPAEWTPQDHKRLSGFGFLSAKPVVALLNGESASAPGERLAALREAAGGEVLAASARNEVEILDLPPEDQEIFRKEYGIEESVRDPLIQAVYRAAGRVSFFTAGEKEVRAWTVCRGATALEAAGTIHTDFIRGFIRAEVVSYDDYVAVGGVKGAKEKGLYRLEGREYVVQEADIVLFRVST